jgi:hypothetical protein
LKNIVTRVHAKNNVVRARVRKNVSREKNVSARQNKVTGIIPQTEHHTIPTVFTSNTPISPSLIPVRSKFRITKLATAVPVGVLKNIFNGNKKPDQT